MVRKMNTQVKTLYDEMVIASKKKYSVEKEDKYQKWYKRATHSGDAHCTRGRLEQWFRGMEDYFGNEINPGAQYGMARGALIVAIRNHDIQQSAFEYLMELKNDAKP